MDDATGAAYLQHAWGAPYATAFRNLALGAIRSDFLRLCFLADRGGFYADNDLCPGNVTLALLRRVAEARLVLPGELGFEGQPAVWNAFMGAPPRHPALLSLAQRAMQRVTERFAGSAALRYPQDKAMEIAGPLLLAPLLRATDALLLHADRRRRSWVRPPGCAHFPAFLNEPPCWGTGAASAWLLLENASAAADAAADGGAGGGDAPWVGVAAQTCPGSNFWKRLAQPDHWIWGALSHKLYVSLSA